MVCVIQGPFERSFASLRMTRNRGGQDMRSGMTQTFDVGHRRALLWSFAFLVHEKPVKLTTKVTKDTKNLQSRVASLP